MVSLSPSVLRRGRSAEPAAVPDVGPDGAPPTILAGRHAQSSRGRDDATRRQVCRLPSRTTHLRIQVRTESDLHDFYSCTFFIPLLPFPPIPVYTYNTYFHSPLHVHTNSVDFHIISILPFIDTVNPYTNGTEESVHISDLHKIRRPKPVFLLPAAVGLSRNYCIPLFPYPQVPMSAVS